MAHRDSYDHGTPAWIDLSSPDVDASKDFYGALFGWDAEDSFEGETRIYTNFSKDGRAVAGLGAQQPEMAGMPPIWSTYIGVDDADAVLAAAEAAGGQVLMPTMQVMDQGSMAILADPTGAVVSLWQAGAHTGAQLVNEPDTWSWNELMTRDLPAATAFYGDVFGWTTSVAMDMGPELGPYLVVAGDDPDGVAGMMGMPPGMPEQVPNHWNVYFTVADLDASLARVAELGGKLVNGPDDSPVGRLATVHDAHGGSFSLIQQPAEV